MSLECFSRVLHPVLLLYYAYVNHRVTDGMDKTHLAMGIQIDDPELERWRSGSPYYFTFWNLLLHQVYFTSCCIEDFLDFIPVLGPIKLQLTARRARRIMLASVLFPCACTVVINFWIMYLGAPNLVFGEFIEAGPSWVNHALHTFVLPVVLLELYLRATTEGVWESGSRKGLCILFALNTVYIATATASAALRGCWPYPFLDNINNGLRVMFFVSVYTSSWLWFMIQNHLVTNIWGKMDKVEKGRTKSFKKKKGM